MAGHDDYPIGVEFEDRYTMQRAMSGDMVLVISPTTCSVAAGAHAAETTREVTITLKTADGEVHKWYNKDVTTGVSIADTHGNIVCTIPSTTLAMRSGVGTVVITLPAGALVAAQTDTLTVSAQTIMGQSVAGGTSVQTVV